MTEYDFSNFANVELINADLSEMDNEGDLSNERYTPV